MSARPAASAPRAIRSAHGHAVDRLGGDIVAGRYPPGAVIPPEPLLGQALGVSRTVVRESIKSLVAKGLITTGPKVGTRVQSEDRWNWFDADVIAWQSRAGLSDAFLRDLQDLRRAIEPVAARLAAMRATAQDIEDLEASYTGMEVAVLHGGDHVAPDLRFHQGLLRASHNRLLAHMGHALGALLRTGFEISTARSDGPAAALPLHRAVLDSVIARDSQHAEAAILRLIDDAGRDIDRVRAARVAPAGAADATQEGQEAGTGPSPSRPHGKRG